MKNKAPFPDIEDLEDLAPARFGKNYETEEESAMTQAACLDRICTKINREGLSKKTLGELSEDISRVGSVYGLDPNGTVLLAAILEKSSCSPIDDEDLARYLGCSNIAFMRYHALLRDMEKAGVIIAFTARNGSRCYRVTQETLKAVEGDAPFNPVQLTGLSTEELFHRFKMVVRRNRGDLLDTDRLLEDLDALVQGNPDLPFCKAVLDSPVYTECNDSERRIFLYMCHRYVSFGNKSVDIDKMSALADFFDGDVMKQIADEATTMQRKGLVTFASEDGLADTDALALSDTVKATFFEGIDIPEEEAVRHSDLIPAKTIQPKELFYNKAEGALIGRLESLLDGENFKHVQERLRATGMRRGFNAIFYGAPGTGKTASVYELARRTGRDIFWVDMAKLKSKWLGESEKCVRGLFRMYRSMCRAGGKAPILLFNEADAIFNKRIENVEQSSDQLNNTLQNLILEELESIEGILVATTNLLSNLDPAFERRFIYKVEFRLPGKESRTKIWKSMVPTLSDEDAETLASEFDFSGGNIENVVRKSTVEYVLSGDVPTLDSLRGYCEEEILKRNVKRNRIGFQQ